MTSDRHGDPGQVEQNRWGLAGWRDSGEAAVDLGGGSTGAQLYSITQWNHLSPEETLPPTVTTMSFWLTFNLLGQWLRRVSLKWSYMGQQQGWCSCRRMLRLVPY